MDEELESLQTEVKQMMEQGEQLLQAAEDCRDQITHARATSCLQELKVRSAKGHLAVSVKECSGYDCDIFRQVSVFGR